MHLHELYFANLGGNGRAIGAPPSLLAAEYGTLEAWEKIFARPRSRSAAARAGCVAYDPRTGSLHNWWAWDHTNGPAGGVPVLVFDLYEHAYQMDYGATTKSYVDAFARNLSWDEVNRRTELARSHAARSPAGA